MELIKEEKRKVIEAEIRVQVMLTAEYKALILKLIKLHNGICRELRCFVFGQLIVLVTLVSFKTDKVLVAQIYMLCLYQVDEQMRQELAEWKLAVDKDKGGKTKGNAKVLK